MSSLRLEFIIVMSLVLGSTPCFAQRHAGVAAFNSANVILLRKSLGEELTGRWISSKHGNVEPMRTYILDSNIVREALQGTMNARVTPVSIEEIDSIASENGRADYIHLDSLEMGSSTAKVIWHWVTACFNKKYNKVVHLLGRTDEAEYSLTPKGWNEVSGSVAIFNPTRP